MPNPRLLITFPMLPEMQPKLQALTQVQLEQMPEEESGCRESLLKRIRGCAGLICSTNLQIDKELLQAGGPSLKVISTKSVGYNHIDLSACREQGIQVGYTPDIVTDATADTTAILTIMTARGMGDALASVKDGRWGPWNANGNLGMQLPGKTIGFLGLGRIGYATAQRLQAFGASRFIYHNRNLSRYAEELGAKRVEFTQLLADSDVLIITANYTPEARHMIRQETLRQMQPHAILINTARGGFVQHEDLAQALKEGIIGAAGLDVTHPEPIDPDHPLVHQPNCIILPHIGTDTVETTLKMEELTLDNALKGIKGEPLHASLT